MCGACSSHMYTIHTYVYMRGIYIKRDSNHFKHGGCYKSDLRKLDTLHNSCSPPLRITCVNILITLLLAPVRRFTSHKNRRVTFGTFSHLTPYHTRNDGNRQTHYTCRHSQHTWYILYQVCLFSNTCKWSTRYMLYLVRIKM